MFNVCLLRNNEMKVDNSLRIKIKLEKFQYFVIYFANSEEIAHDCHKSDCITIRKMCLVLKHVEHYLLSVHRKGILASQH